MAEIVIPNGAKLTDLFHKRAMPMIYLTLGDDTNIPELAPTQGDVVVRKHSSGASATSALDNALREGGIATTFFIGTDTAGCVDATIIKACDRCC